MIHKPFTDRSKSKNDSTFIKFYSPSSPRPTVGIQGVFYVNRQNLTISLWDDQNGKYITFFDKDRSNGGTTTNDNSLVNSNNEPNSKYSFNLINDSLVITDPDGVIIEIPIPNEESINERIRLLEERIEKLERLLD